MPTDILDERGYFWRSEVIVPETQYAHEKCVSGRLRISQNGHITLDLDEHLDRDDVSSRLTRVFQREPVSGGISGILSGSNDKVRLNGLVSNGAKLNFQGPSFESYVAHRALVGPRSVWSQAEPKYARLELPLDDFEQWAGLKGLSGESTARRVRASYRKTKPRTWRLDGQTLEFKRWLDGRLPGDDARLEWRERASLNLVRASPNMSVDEAIDLTMKAEDLLIILSDSNRGLAFPTLKERDGGPTTRLYYPRLARGSEKVTWHGSWAVLEAFVDRFGEILETWLSLHERMGAGVHLYLGNRRIRQMYPEHRFVSLMWGLEAVHRSLHPHQPNPALQRKVERILAGIPGTKDRAWAARNLNASDEPTLAARLHQLFTSLPLALDTSEVHGFAKLSAGRRNDISHFGGARDPADSESFSADIQRLAPALELLYQALLLKLTGLPDELVTEQFYGTNGYRCSVTLERVGIALPDRSPAAG